MANGYKHQPTEASSKTSTSRITTHTMTTLAQSNLGFSLVELMITLSLSILTMFFLYSHYIILISNVSQSNHKVNQFNTAIELQSLLKQKISGLNHSNCIGPAANQIAVINATAGQKVRNLNLPIRLSASFANLNLVDHSQILLIASPSGNIPYRIQDNMLNLVYLTNFSSIHTLLRDKFATYRWAMVTDCNTFSYHKLLQWDTDPMVIENFVAGNSAAFGWIHPLAAFILYLRPSARFANYFDLYLYEGGYQRQLVSELAYWQVKQTDNALVFSFSIRDPHQLSSAKTVKSNWTFKIPL